MILLNKPTDKDSILLTIEYPECSLNLKESFFEHFKKPDYIPKNKDIDYVSFEKDRSKFSLLRLSFGYNWKGSFDNGFQYVTSLHLMPLEDCIYPKEVNIFELESLVYTNSNDYEMYRQYIAYDYMDYLDKETQIMDIHKLLFVDE